MEAGCPVGDGAPQGGVAEAARGAAGPGGCPEALHFCDQELTGKVSSGQCLPSAELTRNRLVMKPGRGSLKGK